MGSKKHKKHHKSEKKEPPVEERLEKPLRLVLKVSSGAASRGGTPSSDYNGESSTVSVKTEPPAPYQETAPTYYSEENADSSSITLRSSEKHKKSKKKKKKKSSEKDKEKKHKHHHRHHHHHHHGSERKVEIIENKPNQPVNEDSNQGNAVVAETEPADNLIISQPVEEMDTSVCTVQEPVVPASPIAVSIDEPDEKSLQILVSSLFISLQKKDPDQFFAWPVSDVIAPGYSTIICNPMDFSTMKQKIDKFVYSSIDEFKHDVKLICNNCMTYNRPETVYYKAAKKLLHSANKMMSKDKLLSLKKSLIIIEQIPSDENTGETAVNPPPIAIEPITTENTTQSEDVASAPVISAPVISAIPTAPVIPVEPPILVPVETQATVEEEPPTKKMKPDIDMCESSVIPVMPATITSISTSTTTSTKSEPLSPEIPIITSNPKPVEIVSKSPEDIEAEQILLQAQAAARCAAEKLSLRRPKNNLAYLTQKEDGTTMLNIINPDSSKRTEREVTFGMVMGKLKSGTGSLDTPKEDKRNLVKPVKQLEFGSYCSFAPSFDTTFADLNKEETNLMYSTYGDELGVQYARSLLRFTENGNFALDMAENILDRLTNGNHQKVSKMLNQKKKSSQDEKLQVKNNAAKIEGTDDNDVQQKLDRNAKLLQDLKNLQHERLSQKLPSHLSHIAPVSEKELQLALQVQDQLKELTMQAAPMNFIDTNAVRKAMGASPL